MSGHLRDSAVKYLNEAFELMQEGKYKEALEELEKADEAAQKAEANDIYLYVQTIKGQLMQTTGAFEEALKIHIFSLKSAEELISKDHEKEPYNSIFQMNLNAIFELGSLFYNMEHFLQAKNCYELHLSIYEKLLKTDSENVVYQSSIAKTLNNLGNLLKKMGSIEDAKDKYEKALNIYEKLLNNDPENFEYQSDVALTLKNLCYLLKNMSLVEYSNEMLEKALDIYKKLLNNYLKLLNNDPENVVYQSYVGGTLNNLGTLLSDMGRTEDAKDSLEKALDVYEKLLNTDPENVEYQSYVGTALNNLGNLLWTMERIEDAKQMFIISLEIYTEPMQYLTIRRRAESIIGLIGLISEQAAKETSLYNKMKYLRESFKLCKKHREFFIKYELEHERKLVTEVGLRAYIDFLMKNVKFETNSKKRAREYEKALQAVEKLGEIENDETVSKLYSSAICYLKGRKLVNEAIASKKLELELLRQAVEQFRNAKETYDKANECFCIYFGLLRILEKFEEFEDVDDQKLKHLIQKVVETLPKDVSPSIRVSFENIPQIFEEKDKITRKELLKELDEKVVEIEYKALENLFGHVQEKIKDYFEEPFSPNVLYDNWKLKILFDDPEKVKGKLTIKAGNKILLNRTLTLEEIRSHILEIDYLDKKYFPQGEDEITFTTPGQKKPVIRSIDYFESILRDNRTRILQCDCCNDVCIDRNLQIAVVQLKYHVYRENNVIKLTVDDAYHRKVMAVLNALKHDVDVVVFPEFSIPFDYLKEIKHYADNTGVIVVAGSHYVTEGHLEEYGELFTREFEEEDLRKNISPFVIPFSRIVHNEELLGSRNERELYFHERMKAGKINHIFKLRDDLRLGLMICYEYLNADLRNRLIHVCDVILVPQTNPNPGMFFEIAKTDLNNPLCSVNRAYIMVNGIFTFEDDYKVLGGSTGIVSTLDKHLYKKQEEGIIKPIDGVMEQFILLASIDTDFNPARDIQMVQVPIKTRLIHIFEESEIINDPRLKGRKFIELLQTIESCNTQEELRGVLTNEENKKIIKAFSPLMHKHIQDLNELTFDHMKEKSCYIMIPAK